MNTGGLEFYRWCLVNYQFSADDKPILTQSFLRLEQLTGYFAENTSDIKWHQGSAMVKRGEVLMQIHSSWVNSELSIASGAPPARVDISTDGFNNCSKKSIHDLRMANMRRAVLVSLNNKGLLKIVADYLKQEVTIETAANNVLIALTQPSISATSNSQ